MPNNKLQAVADAAPNPEQQALHALESIKELFTAMGTVRLNINQLNQAGMSLLSNTRCLKVRHRTRPGALYETNMLPTITLTGQWLLENSFFCRYVQVIAMHQIIIIVPTLPKNEPADD